MLVDNPRGAYSFLEGIAPYSCGVIASPGFEIERVRFEKPVPLDAGFQEIVRRFSEIGRPVRALCGMELRSPAPFTFDGFAEFNAGYRKRLDSLGLLLDGGINPIARTNVAPAKEPIDEPSVYAFSYTVPAESAVSPSFVVAGSGELPEGVLAASEIIARGDVTDDGMRAKIRFVLDLMSARLEGLGVSWDQVTTTTLYSVQNMTLFLGGVIGRGIQRARFQSVEWHYSHPPIEEIEFEMDVRGCRREVVIDASGS